jgi:hypothetical protein
MVKNQAAPELFPALRTQVKFVILYCFIAAKLRLTLLSHPSIILGTEKADKNYTQGHKESEG